MSDRLVVVDVSHWQPGEYPDWQKALDDGIVGVIFKCTESDDYCDPTFRERYDGARAAGLAVASYHFMRPGDGYEQMRFYLSKLEPRQGERVVIDWEDSGVGLEDVHDAVEYLQGDPHELQITVYGSSSFLRERVPAGDALGTVTSLWVASYTEADEPSDFGPAWGLWSLWQYTDKATVADYPHPVDGNRFNGTAEACRRWLDPEFVAPTVDFATVTLTLESDRPVQILVSAGHNIINVLKIES